MDNRNETISKVTMSFVKCFFSVENDFRIRKLYEIFNYFSIEGQAFDILSKNGCLLNQYYFQNEENFPTEISTPGETTTDINWATDGDSKTIFSISDDVTSTTANPVKTLPLDIEALLNITQQEKDEDYVYDYNEPTLPPSLPNLR